MICTVTYKSGRGLNVFELHYSVLGVLSPGLGLGVGLGTRLARLDVLCKAIILLYYDSIISL